MGGVVGVDDQTDTTAGAEGDSSYNNSSSSRTNGVDTVVETRETTPGAVKQINVGVVLDTATATT